MEQKDQVKNLFTAATMVVICWIANLLLTFSCIETMPLELAVMMSIIIIAPIIEEGVRRFAVVKGFAWMFCMILCMVETMVHNTGTMATLFRFLPITMHVAVTLVQVKMHDRSKSYERPSLSWIGLFLAFAIHASYNFLAYCLTNWP